MKSTIALAAVLACAFIRAEAQAQGVNATVAQKEGWIAYQKALDGVVAKVNAACGGTLAGAYDQSSYAAFDPVRDRTRAACQTAVSTLEPVCATEPGRLAVRNLRAVSCAFSTTGTRASLVDRNLVIRIDPERSAITGRQPGSYSWISALKELL
jgi:hypothetical protein